MMIDAKTILKMIENVDPRDWNDLEEIDANVYAYIKLHKDFDVYIHNGGGSITYRHKSWPETAQSALIHLFNTFKVTTSRDALKAIRPVGFSWSFEVRNDNRAFYSFASWENGSISGLFQSDISDDDFATEELAELHAIIQAIEHTRLTERHEE